MSFIRTLVLCFLSFFLLPFLSAQTIPVGSVMDATARSFQLMGKTDSSISFTIRPLSNSQSIYRTQLYHLIDSSKTNDYGKTVYFLHHLGRFVPLPVSIIQQFNTHHPYGWNDGAMIAAKGYQTLVSAGFYAALGPLEIQLQPEWVYAANAAYESTVDYGSSPTGYYQKLFPGQSSIRLSTGAVSIGLSTQNLWWGPGRHSSLLMSNNAPGFLHGFLSSQKPLHTPIGSFEWQLIGGKLTADENWAFENFNLQRASLPYKGSRYLSAYVISYQPKWVPGLFLGMTRGLQRYKKDITLSAGSFLNEYIPVLTKAFQKQNAQGDDTLRTDQLASFFMRWVLPKAKAEFYIEYGFNDYNQNVRDYVMGPTHSAAYIVGVKKIFPLVVQDSYLDVGVEMTQMSQSPDYLLREAGNWYVHGEVRQGYTHANQILGAGAGLGCNVQSASVVWVNGWKQLGVLLERVERDPQYHADKWIDMSIGFVPQYKYKNLVFSGVFQFINSSQYAWLKDVNRFNLHGRVGVVVLF